MSENTNHTTGGTFASDDLIDEQVANTKFVLVQAAAPTAKYDGQMWACTSSDPPLLETYDDTNTQWMQRHINQYQTGTLVYRTLSSPPTLNGALNLCYSTGGATTSGRVYLYFKANGLWWGLQDQ